MSQLFFSLKSIKPQQDNKAGSLTCVGKKEVPGLVNLSFITLKLHPKGFLIPIWHPNANKMGCCLKGNNLISMRTPSGVEVFTVREGEIFFIPQGYVHSIENIGDKESIISFALSHASPEVMNIATAVDSIPDSVLDPTFNLKPHSREGFKQTHNQDLMKILSKTTPVSHELASRYKFNIAESDKVILTKGGYLQSGTKANLSVLQGVGLLGFGLNPHGSVEPHWHTNAGELVYIVKGKTRITVLSPDGHVEVLEVSGGEGAFAPASHFHHIENVGSDQVEVLAFFSHEDPDYLGIGEVVGSYSNEMLASVFEGKIEDFNRLKKTSEPLVIVPV